MYMVMKILDKVTDQNNSSIANDRNFNGLLQKDIAMLIMGKVAFRSIKEILAVERVKDKRNLRHFCHSSVESDQG